MRWTALAAAVLCAAGMGVLCGPRNPDTLTPGRGTAGTSQQQEHGQPELRGRVDHLLAGGTDR